MGKFIVMDIVFYASSLNYDQGSGNYQELKKITKWDGKQYTFVSRYALRYSLLETGRKLGLWGIAEGDKLTPEGSGDQKVIQPAEKLLYNGEILRYPEFDLFGYLITSTTPQNFREAPVKISHAISMIPFNYDSLFNANIGLANRLKKLKGEMKPNPFTSEEHMSYYQYSLVIDLDRIGQIESYHQVKGEDKKKLSFEIKDGKLSFFTTKNKKGEKEPLFTDKKKKKPLSLIIKGYPYELSEVILPTNPMQVPEQINNLISFNPESEVIIWKYKIENKEKIKRIENLMKAILNLHRSIKSRDEDLSPKLLILGLYENEPYKTYKDKIFLKDEYTEEEYDEILEKEENGKIIRKVIHKVSKSKKPIFEVIERESKFESINISEIEKKIEEFIKKNLHNNSRQKSEKNNLNSQNSKEPSTEKSSENEQLKYSKVYLAHSPEIKVKFDKVEDSNEARNSE